MSGEHAKKEMETGDKPATSHEKASSEESRNKGKGKEKKPSSHKSHCWGPSASEGPQKQDLTTFSGV
jgi:predicted flap endonuclease-1-like 5' DNA nuclease